MSRVLIAATPIWGHFAPMLRVACVVAEEHDITVLTSSRYQPSVVGAGLQHMALEGRANFDDRRIDDVFPARRSPRLEDRTLADVDDLVEVMVDQDRSLTRAFRDFDPDLILVDSGFLGAALLLAAGGCGRPLAACGVIPLVDTERDGLTDWLRARRGARLAASFHKVLATRDMAAPSWSVDQWPSRSDVLLQFSVPSLSGGEPGMDHVRYAGRIPTSAPADQDRVVTVSEAGVILTRGTLDSRADSLTWREVASRLSEHEHVTVAGWIDAELSGNPNIVQDLAVDLEAAMKSAVCVVTNGGYGTVQAAIAADVPLVVVPGSASAGDKHAIGRLVEGSGTGRYLPDADPDPRLIVTAVAEARAARAEVSETPRASTEYQHTDWRRTLMMTVSELLKEGG